MGTWRKRPNYRQAPFGMKMILTNENKKEATVSPDKVLSVKAPEWLFDHVEGFKATMCLETRSAALLILLVRALCDWGVIDPNTCVEFIKHHGLEYDLEEVS